LFSENFCFMEEKEGLKLYLPHYSLGIQRILEFMFINGEISIALEEAVMM